MCGILLLIDGLAVRQPVNGNTEKESSKAIERFNVSDFQDFLLHRGPDSHGTLTVCLRLLALSYSINQSSLQLTQPLNQYHKMQTTIPSNPTISLSLTSSLLQLRGTHPLTQLPHQDPASGSILLWNGEVFNGLDIPPDENDGQHLLQALINSSIDTESIPAILSRLRGPWAVVHYEAPTSTLWFGRDIMGRRSLLIREPRVQGEQLIVTSTVDTKSTTRRGCEELPPGLYSIDLSRSEYEIEKHEWKDDQLIQLSAFERAKFWDENGDFGVMETTPEQATHAVLSALRQAVAIRCACISTNTIHNNNNIAIHPAKILILFSGGVDSTLLAALVNECLEEGLPIDLISICFDQGNSPDRLAALDAYEELVSIAPTRPWRLIGTNRKLEDIDHVRQRLITLLAPADTVMDLNIGAALWLAAQGQGTILRSSMNQEEQGKDYKSLAKTVFLGHGADELFGGYSRHRTRFKAAGWSGLTDELAIDVLRLWKRNLGRDDRLIADCSREARHPFLDEAVMQVALDTPLPMLVDYSQPPGYGDKRVLREALRSLGMERAACRVKRAIQFGTKLAKKTNLREFGGTRQVGLYAWYI